MSDNLVQKTALWEITPHSRHPARNRSMSD